MKTLLVIARLFSSIFRPVYYPTLGVFLLLSLSYLSLLPWGIKCWILAQVYFFTIVLPMLLVLLYRRYNRWDPHILRMRVNRSGPYLLHIICYYFCVYLLRYEQMPHCIVTIITVSLLLQICCTFINLFWKVSMHSAGSGAVIGAVAAYAHLFGFNPIWWLCAALMLSGCVMTSRLILRQHTLAQVLLGMLLGIACAYIGITNFLYII